MTGDYETIQPEQFEVKTLIPGVEGTQLRYYLVDQEDMKNILGRLKSDDVAERLVNVRPADPSDRPDLDDL